MTYEGRYKINSLMDLISFIISFSSNLIGHPVGVAPCPESRCPSLVRTGDVVGTLGRPLATAYLFRLGAGV